VRIGAYDQQGSAAMTELWRVLSTAIGARRNQTVFTDLARQRNGVTMLRDVTEVGRRLDAIAPNGATIAVAGQRGYGSLIALLACLATDRPYVPLDLEWPQKRTELVLRESGAAALVTVGQDQNLEITGHTSTHILRHRIADLAYVIFTSGSTGVPKGVMVESEVLRRRLAALVPIITEWCTPTMMLNTSIAFDISLIELLLPLLAGGRIVCPPPVTVAPAEFLQVLASDRPSHVQGTPSYFKVLAALGWPLAPATDEGAPPMEIWCGGEQLDQRLARMLLDRFGRVRNFYGPTEATIWCTVHVVSELELASVGRPIGRTIVLAPKDADSENPGELVLAGDGLAAGYVRESDDDGRFVESPGLGRSYRSGDLGYLDHNGLVHVVGRVDTQVKIDGHRLELAEIEGQLESHPGVHQCAVAVAGENDSRQLIAFVVAKDVRSRELRQHASTVLPAYAVPHRIRFVDALPLTTSGKVDRRRLADGAD
jgi:amino acid adenylation domain-containing protein